jgi:hypothetical protein
LQEMTSRLLGSLLVLLSSVSEINNS